MPRWNGGVIGAANNPTTSSAKGIWSLSEATKAIRAGLWPAPNAGADPYFENVTMLLSADGTNGAQNNTFLDSSTNAFTITRNGNTTQGTFTPFSKPDGRWSNYFDGTGDYLTLPDNSAFAYGTGDFTVECWVYPTALPGSGTYVIIDQRESTPSGGGFSFEYTTTGRLDIATGSVILSSSSNLSTNQWQHIAMSRSGSTLKMFINGVEVGSVSNSTNLTSQRITIGAYTSRSASYFPGYISNLRLVKGTAVYTAAFTTPTAPLTAITNTSLLTCQSNRFIDNSTNAFAITRNGDVSVQTFSPFPSLTAYAAGTNGGSGYFDGSGDYLTVANNTALNLESGDFTVECWFYAVDTTSVKPLIVRFNGNTTARTDLQYYIRINSGSLDIIPYQSTTDYAMSFSNLTANAWHHCALVRTGNNFYAYLDGVRNATTRTITGSLNNNTWETWVGGYREGGTFSYQNGYISSVRVVKGTALYTEATYTVPTTPFTAITNTSLLLSGTNGGIVDAAMSNDLETVGNAQISTTQSKFGGSSMYFDGSGDKLLIPDSQNFNFGSGDFTVECWVYPTASVAYAGIFTKRATNLVYTPIQVLINSGTLALFVSTSGSAWAINANASSSPSLNTWSHIAAVRNGSTITLYLNGTSVASGSVSTSALMTNTAQFVLGAEGATETGNYAGYIDDFRITKGYARYTANFTAPTAAFNGFGE